MYEEQKKEYNGRRSDDEYWTRKLRLNFCCFCNGATEAAAPVEALHLMDSTMPLAHSLLPTGPSQPWLLLSQQSLAWLFHPSPGSFSDVSLPDSPPPDTGLSDKSFSDPNHLASFGGHHSEDLSLNTLLLPRTILFSKRISLECLTRTSSTTAHHHRYRQPTNHHLSTSTVSISKRSFKRVIKDRERECRNMTSVGAELVVYASSFSQTTYATALCQGTVLAPKGLDDCLDVPHASTLSPPHLFMPIT